jgi:hypothetical protein
MPSRVKLRAEYLHCRSWRHSWDIFSPTQDELARRRIFGRLIALRCERCGTKRFDQIDARGVLGSRSYVYPNDYKLAADERPTTEQLRLAIVDEIASKAKQRKQRRRKVAAA